MTSKRIHLVTTTVFLKVVARLMVKFGLNQTSTIIHCVMRVAEQEGITKDGILQKPRTGESHQKS